MSQEVSGYDLKAFEAALGALVPRADRLDRDRLMFLAGQASVTGPLGEGWGEGEAGYGVATSPHPNPLPQAGEGTLRRWAWPTAFSAMTAVAATLFVMLLARPEPQVIVKETRVEVAVPAAVAVALPSDARDAPSLFRSGLDRPGDAAAPLGPLARLRSPEVARQMATQSDREWIDLILADSSPREKIPQSSGPAVVAQAPATYRELLERYLSGAEPPKL